MKIKLKRQRISSAALISFTDVIFLLLIFLLISSNFITHSGLEVKLPTSSSQQNEFNRNLSVSLNNKGEVSIENEIVKWENITEYLKNKLINDPEQVVVIRADEDVPLKQVVKLLDKVQETGTTNFFIATKFERDI